MFNNMKLAVKIGGGFILVLLLTVIITSLSVLSLSSLKKTSYKNDTTSLIVINMQNGTLAGKNYVITKTDSYRIDVENSMNEIIKQATELRDIEKKKTHIDLFNKVIDGATTYKVNFGDYAKYEQQKSGKESVMAEAAGALDADLAELAARNSGLALNIERVMTNLYKCRYNVARFIIYKETKNSDAVQTIMGEVISQLTAMRGRVQGGSAGLVDTLIADAAKYRDASGDYVKLCAVQEESRKKSAEGGALTISNANSVSEAAAAEMSSLISGTTLFLLICAGVAILLGLFLAFIITRVITGAMKKGVDFATLISKGDLTAKLDIHQQDEIGQLASALQDMLTRLTQIVEEVTSASKQVAAGSQQLSSTAQQMSQGATEQASSVEEISSSMEQMTSNIKQNADNALQTEKIARQSAGAAEEGGRAVQATVSAMKEIASKIGIIEEIARSTNMLALNASIEAARAGEYGKGFAVVASEVGKLAERSQKEAGEISKLSTESVTIAEQAGTTIAAMIPDIKRTAELVQEISAASNEQNAGAEQINSAILQLDKVVQQNASASEESASMSEELASQAEQMQATMGYFRTNAAFGKRSAEQAGHSEKPREFIHQIAPAPVVPSPSSAAASAKTVKPSVSTKPAPAAAPSAGSVSPSAPASTARPVEAPSGVAPKTARKAEKDSHRLPLSGIHLVLDDEPKRSGRDSIDSDFQEF